MPDVRGFSLVETIVAIGLLTGALMMLAQLIAMGVHTTAAARYRSDAALLAQQKMEQLRGEAMLADAAGVEHLDAAGLNACGTLAPCAAAVFTVRWFVAPFAAMPGVVLIRVFVSHAHANYGEARSFGVRARSIR